MKTYRFHGHFLMGRKMQKFTRDVKAEKKEDALEEIYTVFGSKHKVSRSRILIDEVEEVEDNG